MQASGANSVHVVVDRFLYFHVWLSLRLHVMDVIRGVRQKAVSFWSEGVWVNGEAVANHADWHGTADLETPMTDEFHASFHYAGENATFTRDVSFHKIKWLEQRVGALVFVGWHRNVPWCIAVHWKAFEMELPYRPSLAEQRLDAAYPDQARS